VRVEVGPRDVQQGACVMARRDRPGKEGKMFGVPMEAGAFVEAVQVPHCANEATRSNSHELDLDRTAGGVYLLVRGTCSAHAASIDTCSARVCCNRLLGQKETYGGHLPPA